MQPKNKPLKLIFTASSGQRLTVKREPPESRPPQRSATPTTNREAVAANLLAQPVGLEPLPTSGEAVAEVYQLSDDDQMGR